MFNPSFLWLVMCGWMVLVFDGSLVAAKDFSKTISVAENPRVEILSKSGDLELVMGKAKEIQIRSDGDLPVEQKEDGKFVQIGKDGFSGTDKVWVALPPTCDLVVRSISGDAKLFGLSGRIRVQTVSGDVSLKKIGGSLSIKTVSGDIRIEQLDAGFEVKTVSGNIKAERVNAEAVEAKTVSGDLRLDSFQVARLRLNTHSGDVWFLGTVTQGGSVQVTTFSGDAELRLPKGLGFDLVAKSRSGDIDTDFEVSNYSKSGHAQEGRVGNGEVDINLTSFSGDLQVRVQK